jgi:hypothetical protein
VLGINGPISASPENYIWVRGATLDLYAAGRARPAVEVAMDVVHAAPGLDDILPADAASETPTSRDARVMAVPGGCRWKRTMGTGASVATR